MTSIFRYVRRHHIALLALFVALGGTSYAAANLPTNSIVKRHIQKGAVGSSEVRNGSLFAADFRSGQLPRGPRGAEGPQGPAGADAANTPQPAVRLVVPTGTVQTYQSGVSDGPVFPTTEYNNGGSFTTGTETTLGGTSLIIPETGVYSVTAQLIWFDPALGTTPRQDNGTGHRSLFLSGPQSGGGIRAGSTVQAVTGDTTRHGFAITERFTAGDEIFLSASQNSGVDLQTRGVQNAVHFSATRLTPLAP